MTQDPSHAGLSPDKVAELERKLADAAAEVAKVQAQLQQARQAGGPPPTGQPLSSTPPGTTIPPYGGPVSPHVISINGQEVAAGSGNLLQMLQQLGQAGAAGGAAPVVMVNGQQLSGGQAVDIGTYLTPEVTQRIASSLQALGLDHGLGAMFGHPPGPPPEPEVVAPLADPPRHVPMSYRIATFNLSVYELFIMMIGTVAPIAVWGFFPIVIPGALIAAVLAIAWFRGTRYVRRIGMLKWGKVATVTNNDILSKGTYYSGLTYNNMRKRTATGWDAKTIWYSGPAYKNKADYTLDGATGSLEWRGLRYQQGIILADSRKPGRAMEVSMFPYSVKPGPDGQLTGELSAWLWGGIISTLVIEATVVYLAAYAVLELWVNR